MTIRKGNTIIAGNTPAGYEIGDIGLSAIGIDESLNYRRYLNGQEILQSQFKEFTKKIKRRVELYPSLSCTNEEYETACALSAHGQCGKFVIDDERGVIRLPKVVNVMGLSDMAEAGVTVDAGLPNIEATAETSTRTDVGGTGALYGFAGSRTDQYKVSEGNNGLTNGIGFDASRSNPTYGNSETVQQEAIKYPYFIQVASSCETAINLTRDIELNNPFSLFEYKFSEYAIDNISWLESKGQWNSNKVYVSAYEELLAIYNGKVREGVSVKKTTETYTDYDFVIDEAGNAFRLPTKVKGAAGKAVVGNGMALGLTNGTDNLGSVWTANAFDASASALNSPVGGSFSGDAGVFNNKIIGVTQDPSKSGIETSTEGMKLYFYVGETVQDSNLINAGAVLEDVNTLKNTALTTGQITNCITEIPQRIKVELKDGVITLKAGSEVIIPNGFEEDGTTPKFDYLVVEKDYQAIGDTARQAIHVFRPDNERWGIDGPLPQEYCFSGNTAPTSFYGAAGFAFWYDTASNLMKYTADKGATWSTETMSLPLFIATETTTAYTSIDQVFNGIGYIGSTIWVDKGVKALIPNGKKADGTLNNEVREVSELYTYNIPENMTASRQYINLYGQLQNLKLATYGTSQVFMQENAPVCTNTHVLWLDTRANKFKYTENSGATWTAINLCNVGIWNPYNSTGKLLHLQSNVMLSRGQSPEISSYSMPSNKYIDLTLGATGSTYTAPANGWYSIDLASTSTSSFGEFYKNGVRIAHRVHNVSNQSIPLYAPFRKGDILDVRYSNATLLHFRFYYAQGEV